MNRVLPSSIPAAARFLFALLFSIALALPSVGRVWAQTAGTPSDHRRWAPDPTSSSTTATAPQPRFALIIGNAHYGGDHDLKNPENDARAMAATLRDLGFKTNLLLDATREQMRDGVYTLCDSIAAAGSQAVVLLYYSGHGAQVAGVNYLVPLGFSMPAHADDMADRAVSAQWVLGKMQDAHAQVSIAILDACRDNPFEHSRSLVGKGLSEVTAARGVYVAYATAADSTAEDNPDGANGLYTQELLRYLKTPGLTVDQVFKKTRAAVNDASHGSQFPYVYDGLLNSDTFYLNGGVGNGGSGPAPLPDGGAGSGRADNPRVIRLAETDAQRAITRYQFYKLIYDFLSARTFDRSGRVPQERAAPSPAPAVATHYYYYAALLQESGSAFADVPSDGTYSRYVDALQKAGIIIGYPDGTAGGARAIVRYEAAMAFARLADTLRLSEAIAPVTVKVSAERKNDQIFQPAAKPSDVPRDHWASRAIGRLGALGLLPVYADGRFGGDRAMTMAEAVSSTWRVP